MYITLYIHRKKGYSYYIPIYLNFIRKLDVLIAEMRKINPQQVRVIDKNYFTTIGSILNNVKDWDDHRLLRRKTTTITNVDEQTLNFYVDENQVLQLQQETAVTEDIILNSVEMESNE